MPAGCGCSWRWELRWGSTYKTPLGCVFQQKPSKYWVPKLDPYPYQDDLFFRCARHEAAEDLYGFRLLSPRPWNPAICTIPSNKNWEMLGVHTNHWGVTAGEPCLFLAVSLSMRTRSMPRWKLTWEYSTPFPPIGSFGNECHWLPHVAAWHVWCQNNIL